MRDTYFMFVLLLPHFKATRAILHSGKRCFGSYKLVVDDVDYNDTRSGDKMSKSCQSLLKITSLFLRFNELYKEKGRAEWLSSADETCQYSICRRMYHPLQPSELWSRRPNSLFDNLFTLSQRTRH